MRHLVRLVWVLTFAGLTLPATGVLLCSHDDGCTRWSLTAIHRHVSACDTHAHDASVSHDHHDGDHHDGENHDGENHDGDSHGGTETPNGDQLLGSFAVHAGHGTGVTAAMAPAPVAIDSARPISSRRLPTRAVPAPQRPPTAPLVLRV